MDMEQDTGDHYLSFLVWLAAFTINKNQRGIMLRREVKPYIIRTVSKLEGRLIRANHKNR